MSDLITPRSLALSFGCLSICYGMKALIYPSKFADDFGFPSATTDSVSNSERSAVSEGRPFVIAYGGRTMTIGAAIALLAWENQVRAAGTVTICCAISGMTDTVNCYMSNKPLLQHAALPLLKLSMWLSNLGGTAHNDSTDLIQCAKDIAYRIAFEVFYERDLEDFLALSK